MSETCNHDCSGCEKTCDSRVSQPESFRIQSHPLSKIKKIIGIVSGKGGVGKSFVTASLASTMTQKGYRCAILDGDITGPSIARIFNIHEKAYASEEGLLPLSSKSGIQIMSINMLLEEEETPVVWRGPVVAGMVKQFYTDVIYSDVDVLFVDMPPGTSDVPLTIFQSLPLDGIVLVTTPQSLVSMVVSKAINMAKMMDIPILGLIENMSYLECDACGKRHDLFTKSNLDQVALENGIKVLGQIPLRSELTQACDEGKLEDFKLDFLQDAIQAIEAC